MSESSWPAELEAALRDAGAHLRYPEGRDLSAPVAHRIRLLSTRRANRSPFRSLAAALALVVLLAAAVTVLSPGTRRAVAGWLGISGISIVQEPPPGRIASDDLALGRRVNAERARDATGFDIVTPADPALGSPDQIYLSEGLPEEVVTLIYAEARGLPAMGDSGVGLLITEFRARIDETFLKKLADSGVRIRPIVIAGSQGYWVEGRHALYYAAGSGPVEYRSRLAHNTLIWERGALSLRLESGLPLLDALRIARSM